MDAMFCVRWLVTASSRHDPIAESATHSSALRGRGRARRAPPRLRPPPARPRGAARAGERRRGAQHARTRRSRRTTTTTAPPAAAKGSISTGIGQQREQRGEVRQREQAVRRRVAEALPEPRLHQRAGGREQEIRQPDGRRQQAQYQERRLARRRRLPARVGNDRQDGEAQRQQADVHPRLPARGQAARGPVGIGVAEEQHRLEEHQADRPHRGRAAEPRQDLLRDDGLDQEQQERAEEDRGGVEEHELGCSDAEVLVRSARGVILSSLARPLAARHSLSPAPSPVLPSMVVARHLPLEAPAVTASSWSTSTNAIVSPSSRGFSTRHLLARAPGDAR